VLYTCLTCLSQIEKNQILNPKLGTGDAEFNGGIKFVFNNKTVLGAEV
jgi:hypothetical protein